MDDITYETQTTDEGTVIKRTEADGTVWWVPEAPGNRHYEEYLRYTAWVEAGNSPEDFWVAEGDTAEVIVEETN